MTKIKPAATMIAGFVLLGTAGCSQVPQHVMGRDFGEATYHNAAVQVIDPMPEHADAGAPDLNGNRATLAIQRYEANQVKEPVTTQTTTVLSGGSGGGGN